MSINEELIYNLKTPIKVDYKGTPIEGCTEITLSRPTMKIAGTAHKVSSAINKAIREASRESVSAIGDKMDSDYIEKIQKEHKEKLESMSEEEIFEGTVEEYIKVIELADSDKFFNSLSTLIDKAAKITIKDTDHKMAFAGKDGIIARIDYLDLLEIAARYVAFFMTHNEA